MEKFLNNKKETSERWIEPLSEAYREIYGKNPNEMEEWQIAQSILEVLDNPEWVSEKIAKECLYKIVQVIRYPDDKTREKIVLEAERMAKNIFPEIVSDEAHMDEIEWAYRKWKENND